MNRAELTASLQKIERAGGAETVAHGFEDHDLVEPDIADIRVRAEGAHEEVADAASADEQVEQALPPGRALEEAVQPGHLAGLAGVRGLCFTLIALAAYRESERAEGVYNQGNALARLGQYRAAIEAYDRALMLEPALQDAEFNKRLVEGLLARRDRDAVEQDRPPTQATPEPRSSQSEDDSASSDTEQASDAEQASPSGDGTDGGQAAAESQTEQADKASGGQQGTETDEAQASASDAGEQPGEASSAGQEQVGDRKSNDPAEGEGRGNARTQGSVADGSVAQGGVESGDEVIQGGVRDASGDGRAVDAAAEQPGQEDSASDRVRASETPSPDTRGEDGHWTSTKSEQAGATGDDNDVQPPGMPGRDSPDREHAEQEGPGAGEPAERQANEVGSSFAEANRRLAERREQGSEGIGDLPEVDASSPAAGLDATAPTGPGLGDDPSNRQESLAGASQWTTEERLAAEQWLRRIPDDPGGLLRRKFLYQYRERQRAPGSNPPPPR